MPARTFHGSLGSVKSVTVHSSESVLSDAKPAGFFLRVIAAIVDLAILVSLTWLLGMVLIHTSNPSNEQDQLATIFLVVSAVYSVGLNLKLGGTPGKLLLKLRVVRMRDGGLMRWHQALARWASYLLSIAIFGAGFLMAAFHPLKRTIHDLMAGTRVVRLGRTSGRPDT